MTALRSAHPGRRVVGATATGAAHLARGRPNQDHVGCIEDDGWAFLAVADGHGAPAHGRSDRGARMAADVLLRCSPRSPGLTLFAMARRREAGWTASARPS